MGTDLVIVGAGGFGREVADVIDAINAQSSGTLNLLGFIDDGQPDRELLEAYGVGHLGGIEQLEELPASVGYVIGIGSPGVRANLDARLASVRDSPVLVHPAAVMARRVELGAGSIVCANATITNHIRLGRHVHVNINCTIGHDAVLADHVTLSPLVAVSGNVTLEARAFVGTGVTINPGVTIGEDAVIASGATVLKNVDPQALMAGVPAKRIR